MVSSISAYSVKALFGRFQKDGLRQESPRFWIFCSRLHSGFLQFMAQVTFLGHLRIFFLIQRQHLAVNFVNAGYEIRLKSQPLYSFWCWWSFNCPIFRSWFAAVLITYCNKKISIAKRVFWKFMIYLLIFWIDKKYFIRLICTKLNIEFSDWKQWQLTYKI